MRVPRAVRRISLRVWFVVVLILFCDISCGVLADSSADLRNANDLIAVEKYDDALKVLQALPTSDVLAAPQALELIGDCYRLKLMFVEAAAAYESALSKHKLPDEQAKRIRRWLIKCHIRAREWGKVESEIEAIAAESPECAAWSYYSLGSHYRRFKNYDKAVAAFENAIPKSASVPAPDGKLVREALVDCYTGSQQWDKATDLLTKLATQYPDESSKWHELAGAIYQGQKKYREAIAEFTKAIGPDDAVSARKRLGECYRDSLSPSQAAPLIFELAHKHPKDGPYLPTIAGKLYQGLNDNDKAIAAYKFVVETYPDARWQVWDACYYIGECCYVQSEEKGQEALAYIKNFYAKHPDRPMDFAIAYGKTLLFAGEKPAEAAEVLSRTLTEHPNDPLVEEVRTLLIAAYADAKQTDSLAELLSSMSASAPDSEKAGIILRLVDHYIAVRKFREGASLCRAVLAIKNSHLDSHAHAEYQLGICYYHSNMSSAAMHSLNNVVKRYPDSEWAVKARGILTNTSYSESR